ncbi:hypothetical protein FA13DRAFT_806813 [Coprinellus micaceus]|uniref:Uncharacterized protein n=1 Tax=Coprinellus micaceus TaxID=71717 RepID=A0A4Y7T347_COPMI|nr:hypothetical protein FA13DRAFT_806813 [Coprinellus micaceus]
MLTEVLETSLVRLVTTAPSMNRGADPPLSRSPSYRAGYRSNTRYRPLMMKSPTETVKHGLSVDLNKRAEAIPISLSIQRQRLRASPSAVLHSHTSTKTKTKTKNTSHGGKKGKFYVGYKKPLLLLQASSFTPRVLVSSSKKLRHEYMSALQGTD